MESMKNERRDKHVMQRMLYGLEDHLKSCLYVNYRPDTCIVPLIKTDFPTTALPLHTTYP